jgi:hypothetical protein
MKQLSIDDRIDNLQEYIVEQLQLVKEVAFSQAVMAEQQAQAACAQMAATDLLKYVRVDVVRIVKTTDSILGISRRLSALMNAYSRGSYASMMAFTLDPWLCLYLYIMLHPVAPKVTEFAASYWQFVLFAHRLLYIWPDLKSIFSVGLILYFTSPYKAVYYLYWLNRAFVHGTLQRLEVPYVFQDPPAAACRFGLGPAELICAADYTVSRIGHTGSEIKSYIFHSELSGEVIELAYLEWTMWVGILQWICSMINGWIYSRIPVLKYFL